MDDRNDMTWDDLVANFETFAMDDLPDALGDVLLEAIRRDASDVHVDPNDMDWSARLRIRGVLTESKHLASEAGLHLLNQAKIAGQMRSDRHFEPEEGRMRVNFEGERYDIRLSVVPTIEGESLHMRILSARWGWESLSQLGFSEQETRVIFDILAKQTGLILVGGTTGGGKTTTLYKLTTLLEWSHSVIASIEDPVEYAIPGVRQIQVDPEHGLTMAEGLKVLLRMDPDVILVGEIRDSGSAQIAARAALTGALVIATVHAPDPMGVVATLQNLSVPKHVIGGALRAIISQELLPVVCQRCAMDRKPTAEERELFEIYGVPVPAMVKDARGCSRCDDSGSMGRTVVAEVLPVDSALGDALMNNPQQALKRCYEERRVGCLASNALTKVARGEVAMDAATSLVTRRQRTL